MKFKEVNFFLLVFLIVYWIAAIFFIILLVVLGVAVLLCLKSDDVFHFDWIKESIYALRKAVPGSGVLGAGIWLKAKLEAKK